jgi:hypothetical protein
MVLRGINKEAVDRLDLKEIQEQQEPLEPQVLKETLVLLDQLAPLVLEELIIIN